MNFKHILLIMGLLIFVLSACQPETTNLPTLVVLPTETATEIGAEVIPSDTAPELSTEIAEPTTLPTETPLFPLADDGTTQVGQLVPDFTPPPTTDIFSLGSGMQVDFSTIAVGDTISLLGTLTIDDTVEPQQVIVTDRDGNRVVIDITAEMAGLIVDTSVYVVGTVTSTEGGVVLQLLTLQEMSEATAEAPMVMSPSFEVTPDSTPEAALPGVVETMRLAANLTVLDAFDQLVGQLGAQLDNRVWISASGNVVAGWSFNFYDERDESVLIYQVLADGTVISQPGLPPLDTDEIFALDRELITIDSEELLAAYDETEATEDRETIVLLLQAVDAETVNWSILDVDGQPVFVMNAASGDVLP